MKEATKTTQRSNPKLPFGTNKCCCSVCGEYFNSTHAFDKHRVGKPTIDRRCLTVEEMRGLGFSVSATGHWITKTRSLEGTILTGPYPSLRVNSVMAQSESVTDAVA